MWIIKNGAGFLCPNPVGQTNLFLHYQTNYKITKKHWYCLIKLVNFQSK